MKTEIKKDAICPICKELLLNDDLTLKKTVLGSDLIGVVHDFCFLPYHKEENGKLLFKIRCYSIGDTIAATPVLREVRRLYPKMLITVLTFFPELFKYNPHIDEILDLNRVIEKSVIDSFMFQIDAFDETRGGHFAMHSVDFSAMCAIGRQIYPTDWDYEVKTDPESWNNVFKIIKENGITSQDELILINPHGTEWPTRDWGKYRFAELAKKIQEKYPEYKLVSIGGKRSEVPSREMKNYVEIPGAIDLYGKMTLLESIAFMNMNFVKLLITPDTGTLHIGACANELPIIGIFTLVRSYFRTPVRNQRMGYKFIGVESDSDCKCTYSNRFLTNEMNFSNCPKKTFLDKTFELDIPRKLKLHGMQNYDPAQNWTDDGLGKQIQNEAEKYKPESLPCFPSVEKVMMAVDKFLETK